jgi:uncharacterized protein (DUF427 family)
MSLTFARGPLSGDPADTNYRIQAPAHRLFFEDFPRRVRSVFGGETVMDTRRGKLLHESGLLPQLYVPRQDVRAELLEKTHHNTHCPFKGTASYWTVRVGERAAENALWAYPQPREDAGWLRDYVAFYWGLMDAWFDEDEEVHGHLRDPYHRVDVRATNVKVRIVVEGDIVAATGRSKLLSETGLPNRFYVPPEDVRTELLEPSAKHTVCPYKGTASYRTLRVGNRRIFDAAWFYPEPLENALKIRSHLCFLAEGIEIEIDGKRI